MNKIKTKIKTKIKINSLSNFNYLQTIHKTRKKVYISKYRYKIIGQKFYINWHLQTNINTKPKVIIIDFLFLHSILLRCVI